MIKKITQYAKKFVYTKKSVIPQFCPADEYDEYFEEIRHVIGNIVSCNEAQLLIDDLSSITGISIDEIRTLMCRRIAVAAEYAPQEFEVNRLIAYMYFILKAVTAIRLPTAASAERPIIFDTWTKDSHSRFYKSLNEALTNDGFNTKSLDITKYRGLDLRDLLAFLPQCILLHSSIKGLEKKSGHDATLFVTQLISDWLAGKKLARSIRPKIIVSANDNGSLLGLCRGAAAPLVLIQNGLRPPGCDSAYLASDVYLAMDRLTTDDRSVGGTGRFVEMIECGYISLATYISENGSNQTAKCYDITIVSDLLPSVIKGQHGAAGEPLRYSSNDAIVGIDLIRRLAEQTRLKIAYLCRNDGEEQFLRANGLMSPEIVYFSHNTIRALDLVCQSMITVATYSTTPLEAIAAGLSGAFLMPEGRESLVPGAADLDLVFSGNSTDELLLFLLQLPSVCANARNHLPPLSGTLELAEASIRRFI